MKPVYLLVGPPGSGKTWVTTRLRGAFHIIPHDDYISRGKNSYVEAIKAEVPKATKPVLIETPFSMTQLTEPLEKDGIHVTPVFIIEAHSTLRLRYSARGKEIPQGHLTRSQTYLARAIAGKHFHGTSTAVLHHLLEKAKA